MITALAPTAPAPMRVTRATSDATLITSWLNLRDSERTRQTYALAIEQFFAWLGERTLQTLTVDDLADYRAHLAASGASKATQALKLNTVKSLLAYGHRVGYLAFDVGKAVKAAKVPSELAERILPEWQVMQLLHHPELKERDRLLLRLLYASGGRVSEIINLRWRHVQPSGDSGQITVTGKGGKTRAIKLSKDTWFALQCWRPADAGPDDYVFQSQRRQGQEHRQGQLDRTAVNKIVSNAGKLVGVKGLSPHWLRHAHASHALDKGAPVSLVAQTLGHASVATTSKYLHAKPGESSATYLSI
jgi:site-specific recombinase XerD